MGTSETELRNIFFCGGIYCLLSTFRELSDCEPLGLKISGEHLCVECGKTFVSLERVNEHKALIHKTDAIMHNCKVCKKSFKNERIYKAHTKSNHLNLPCSMCDKKFSSRRALNNHKKKKHENPTIDPPNFKYSDQ